MNSPLLPVRRKRRKRKTLVGKTVARSTMPEHVRRILERTRLARLELDRKLA